MNSSLISFFFLFLKWTYLPGLPWWLDSKESTCQAGDEGLIPGSGRFPEEGNGFFNPPPVFLPGKSHGQRKLSSYCPWGRKRVKDDSATKQQLVVQKGSAGKQKLTHMSLQAPCGVLYPSSFQSPPLSPVEWGIAANILRLYSTYFTKPSPTIWITMGAKGLLHLVPQDPFPPAQAKLRSNPMKVLGALLWKLQYIRHCRRPALPETKGCRQSRLPWEGSTGFRHGRAVH